MLARLIRIFQTPVASSKYLQWTFTKNRKNARLYAVRSLFHCRMRLFWCIRGNCPAKTLLFIKYAWREPVSPHSVVTSISLRKNAEQISRLLVSVSSRTSILDWTGKWLSTVHFIRHSALWNTDTGLLTATTVLFSPTSIRPWASVKSSLTMSLVTVSVRFVKDFVSTPKIAAPVLLKLIMKLSQKNLFPENTRLPSQVRYILRSWWSGSSSKVSKFTSIKSGSPYKFPKCWSKNQKFSKFSKFFKIKISNRPNFLNFLRISKNVWSKFRKLSVLEIIKNGFSFFLRISDGIWS